MFYLTLNDPPSGVYFSQVIAVCDYLSERFGVKVQLISVQSLRNFSANRAKIKARHPSAWVIPAVPKVKLWKLNFLPLLLLLIFRKRSGVLCRGATATWLGLNLKQWGIFSKVGYDGRGAFDAEWQEYDLGGNAWMKEKAFAIERRAVMESDFRLAVSQQLVLHWQEKYNYSSENHCVIPCTLNPALLNQAQTEAQWLERRKRLGVEKEDILLIYSGSVAGWQSFDLTDQFLLKAMENDTRVKALFLSKLDLNQLTAYQKYPDRIQKAWVSHEEVTPTMSIGDYGIMIREKSITNRVAAPTKFAEYLAAGLKVLISEELGDYPAFVTEHKAGIIVKEIATPLALTPTSKEEKQRLTNLARVHFVKDHFASEYQHLLNKLG